MQQVVVVMVAALWQWFGARGLLEKRVWGLFDSIVLGFVLYVERLSDLPPVVWISNALDNRISSNSSAH